MVEQSREGETGDGIDRTFERAAALQVCGLQLCPVANVVGCCSFCAAEQEVVLVMSLQACCVNTKCHFLW